MKLTLTAAAILSALLITGCDSDSDPEATGFTHDLPKLEKLLENNAAIAYAKYKDSVITAEALQTALVNFQAAPTQPNLDAAKRAWLIAREPYGQSEVFRFRNSPIDDDPTTAAAEDGPEGAVNAWPLGEALIDYVVATGVDFAGGQIETDHEVTGVVDPMTTATAVASQSDNIIGSTITINAALLEGSEAGDGADVISGYHAIEFMLWGQDLNNTAAVTSGSDREMAVKTHDATNLATGGLRPLTDFKLDGTCTTGNPSVTVASNVPCQRRHDFLKVVADQLVADLSDVRDQWAPNVAGNYRASFTSVASIDEAKPKFLQILTGMGTLSEAELAGERMQISLAGNSQEDEHSCFSDNTHRDIWLNAEGVSNLFTGVYAGFDSTLDGIANVTTNAVDGFGIDDYLAHIGATTLASELQTALATTEIHYRAIDVAARAGNPVDVLIMNATGDLAKPMRDTITSLHAQAIKVANVAIGLGLGTKDQVIDPDGSACDTTNPTLEC